MKEPANFATLPTEILLLITANFSGTGDVNAICQLTSRLYDLFLPDVFERRLAWARSTDRPKKERSCLVQIFLHAVKYNSTNLIRQLFFYTGIVDFKGNIPGTPFSHYGITYFHFAVTMDAPTIASHLMKHGSSSDVTIDSLSTIYPDLAPLYMSLARPNSTSPRELNAALRIACSYALPRTATFLLARGADARAVSNYGISVLHATLTRRARWTFFDDFYGYMEPNTPLATLWEDFILAITKSLVSYGANPRLKIDNSRAHTCDAKCWRSVNCEHSQQSPTHLAAASGFTSVVQFLYKTVGHCALSEEDGGGYTPLYGACVQGHELTAMYILQKLAHTPNLMVRDEDKSTALHIASRFALDKVATWILEHGAEGDIDREDAKGRTALHEVLSHGDLEREYEIKETLHILARFEANPDQCFTPTSSSSSSKSAFGQKKIETPRQVARNHVLLSVRDMFRLEKENVYKDWCEEAEEESRLAIADSTRVAWGEEEETKPETTEGAALVKKPRKKSKKQRERIAAKEHEQNFPSLSSSSAHERKESSDSAKMIENLPPSLYRGTHRARKLVEWEQNHTIKTQTTQGARSFEVKPVANDHGMKQTGKAKGKGRKNQWKKMTF